MIDLFTLQVLVSFFVGGAFVAALTFLSEKAGKKAAGIIITIASTVLVSFFFIGWVVSPYAVAEIVPVSIVGIGLTSLFAVAYLYLSRIRMPRGFSILICSFVALALWFAGAIPLVLIEFSDLTMSLVAYFLMITVSYVLLTVLPKIKVPPCKFRYSAGEKITRYFFAGFVIALAVFLSKVLSPFWGGIFAAFPAAFFSALVILHRHHDSDFLFRTFYNAPIGSISTVVFALAAAYTFPPFGFVVGTILSFAISLVAAFVLYHIPSYQKN